VRIFGLPSLPGLETIDENQRIRIREIFIQTGIDIQSRQLRVRARLDREEISANPERALRLHSKGENAAAMSFGEIPLYSGCKRFCRHATDIRARP
jgi:hypothetical protein